MYTCIATMSSLFRNPVVGYGYLNIINFIFITETKILYYTKKKTQTEKAKKHYEN